MYANVCFETSVLFMRACACVALSGWRVKNYHQDNRRKYLGPVVYRKRVPRAAAAMILQRMKVRGLVLKCDLVGMACVFLGWSMEKL